MISKNTKRMIAFGVSLSTISGAMPLIITSTSAYAEEQTYDAETQLTNAENNLKEELNNYDYSFLTTKENVDSILNTFSYTTTTGSSVIIKAKESEDFINEDSNCSFKVKLYNEADESSTKLLDFSYPCNNITTGSMVSLMGSSAPTEWTTSETLNPSGDTITINGVVFTLTDSTNKYVSVTRCTNEIDENLKLPSKVKCGSIEYSVKSIGQFAFQSSNLVSVIIPNSVTTIHSKSFDFCKNMTSINVAEDNLDFTSKDGILYNKNQTFLIKYPANKVCSQLDISDSTLLNRWALNECAGLEAINVSSSHTYYSTKDGVLYDTSRTKLLKYPGGKSDEEFEIPNTVAEMNEYAFSSADKLKNIKIPGNVKNIGWFAFDGCSSLENVDIGEGVEKIEYQGFSYCTSLESIEIPSSVKEISDQTFFNCNGLKNINVDINNLYYKSINGVVYSKDGKKIIQYPIGKDEDSYVIEDGVETIGESAFFGATKLKNITISNDVTTLEMYSFNGCSGLTKVHIPSKVTTLKWGAFQDCQGLTNVLIPDNVTKIDGFAFAGCNGLKTVFIPESLTTIADDAFSSNYDEYLTIFNYKISNGEIKITGIYGGNVGTHVIIPYEIDGIRVTDIAEDLFKGVSGIESITCCDKELNKKITDLLKDEAGIIIKGIREEGYSGKFDGKNHSIKVNDTPEGSIITYSTIEDGVYSETNPSYKDKGIYTVYYKVLYGTDELEKGSATISIGDCDHEFSQWIIRKEPTYTEKGETYRVCSICGEEQVEEIPMLVNPNPSNGGGSSSKGSSNKSAENETNNKIVINTSNDEISIIDAINNPKLNTIEINLDNFNKLNEENGVSKVFLSEQILKALKANPNKRLILKTTSKASDKNINDTNTNFSEFFTFEVKSTEDKQIQFTQNNNPLFGFKTIANGEYNLNLSGIMQIGWVSSPEKTKYHFNSLTGVKDKNWIKENSKWYYLDSFSGTMKTGWLKDNGVWYYLSGDGAMVVGWNLINGKWYLFNINGSMEEGWIQMDNNWYYLNTDGSMAIGWVKVNEKWYYLHTNGSLAVNVVINGYEVDRNGVLID